MPSTIIKGFSGGYDYEPNITTENGRDGITTFQFSIIGDFAGVNSAFQLAESIGGVPDQPPGLFLVVRRSIEHIVGGPDGGLYRLVVVGEGGEENTRLEITQSSYAYQKEEVSGTVSFGGDPLPARWVLEWLSPTVSIITNSRSNSADFVQGRARELVSAMDVQVIRNRPGVNRYEGPRIDEEKIIISGSNIEVAGGLYRVSATATKGVVEPR